MLLSLRIALVATVVALPFGIAIAWVLARKDFWGKALLDGLVHLPLVLPPVVTGYLLLRLREQAVPMIYVSHHAAEVKRIATTIVRLEEGRMAGIGGAELLATADDNAFV